MDPIILKNKAISDIKIADHILVMTYPIVQDPKLLKIVLQKLHSAIKNSMMSLLYYEKKQKRISSFNESYMSMLTYIKKHLTKYNISPNYLIFLSELNDLFEYQKKSDIEFIRKDKFVFTNKDYKLKTLTKEDMKTLLIKGKLFIKEITDVVR
ncbi:hypothetical protein HOF18_05795 [archaeon]|nr:hypothetical protein [archaeon]